MTNTVVFDTLAYANKLKIAGVDAKAAEAQAEATAEILNSLVKDGLATKDDIKDLRYELKEFMVKIATTIISVLGGLLTLFHFIK